MNAKELEEKLSNEELDSLDEKWEKIKEKYEKGELKLVEVYVEPEGE